MGSPATAHPSTAVMETSAILSQAGSENFPVASRLLPRSVRADLLAVYGFARLADDIGDEAEGDRLALLDWLESEVALAACGEATHPLLRRLGETIRARRLPLEPMYDLIRANRQDQIVTRYETFDDLIGYCMLSAAPVGRLVLAVLDESSPDRVALSDDVCNGLQVVEHLQDVAEDLANGRIYLPLADLRRFDCKEEDLAAPTAGPAVRAVVAAEVGRARQLLGAAVPLARSLPLRARLAIAAFAAGGHAALDAIVAADYDVLGNRCRPQSTRLLVHAAAIVRATTRATTRATVAAGAGAAGPGSAGAGAGLGKPTR